MSDSTHKVGDIVTFTTPGRYPKTYTGKIKSIDSAFAVIDVDGTEKKARPATLRAG